MLSPFTVDWYVLWSNTHGNGVNQVPSRRNSITLTVTAHNCRNVCLDTAKELQKVNICPKGISKLNGPDEGIIHVAKG